MPRDSGALARCVLCVALLLTGRPDLAATGRAAQRASDAAVAALVDEGAYDRAEAFADAQLSAARGTYGASSLESARAADVLVRVLCLNGKGTADRSLQLANDSLEIKRRSLQP